MMNYDEPLYDIKLLGRMEIRRNGELRNKVHKKGIKMHKALVCLILARGNTVPDQKLIKATGIDMERNAETALKVMIHRLRSLMPADGDSEPCIIRMYGGYAWNMKFDARVDLFEAESVCERVMTAERYSCIRPEDTSALLELYAGESLPEIWDETSMSFSEYRLESQYSLAISHLLTLMWIAHAINEIIFVCLRGLEIDPTERLFMDHLNRASSAATRDTSKQNERRINYIMRGGR